MVLHQMFTVSGLIWYCGGVLWTATFSEQRVCENFEERLSDSAWVQYDMYHYLGQSPRYGAS